MYLSVSVRLPHTAHNTKGNTFIMRQNHIASVAQIDQMDETPLVTSEVALPIPLELAVWVPVI